jgi:hypothetical protein
MSIRAVFAFLILSSGFCVAQNSHIPCDGSDRYRSVFQDLTMGSFSGTANGALFVQRPDGSRVILDFQAGEALLQVTADPHAVYDLSTKTYIGHTTSGRSKVIYSTYNQSHGLVVELNGRRYGDNTSDGAACAFIRGIDFYYSAEDRYGYLVLRFDEAIRLAPLQDAGSDAYLTVLPKSSLVFVINRR